MNDAVIVLSVVIGLIGGGLVWRLKRSILAALVVPLLSVGFLTWALQAPEVPPFKQGTAVAIPAEHPSASSLNPMSQPAGEISQAAESTFSKLAAFRPVEVTDLGYSGSDTCRECHSQQHSTWFASYHRTMTQVASPEIVMGDFNNVSLTQHDRDYRLKTSDGVCWVEMLEPTAMPGTPEASERVQRPIVMATGSHHMQAYWFPIGVERTLALLPFVFLNETQEWIPRSAAFLKPVEERVSHEIGRWNSACSKCHSTHPQVRELPDGGWDTRAAEFGISCEACHGPGQQHVAYRRGLAASSQNDTTNAIDPIINPDSLSHVRSSQVCGQCHAVLTLKGDQSKANIEGIGFRPGTDLRETFNVWQLHSPEMEELLKIEAIHERVVNTNRGTFYPDGVVRVSGREFTSLEQSACFQRGEMGCLTCHQLHQAPEDSRDAKEWANDQLKPKALTEEACVQCHDSQQYATAHTHHMPESTGSNCYNCHMPHTAYGLLKAIRNHTITSPNLKSELAVGRPNACNQCHLDKTLAWTAKHLREWYAIEEPELDADQAELAASVLWLLEGDASSRAIAAWTMGWSDAQEASGTAWQSIFLAQLLNDPYLAVRLIARRSLNSIPSLADLKIDPLGDEASRRDAVEAVSERWKLQSHALNPALLINQEKAVDHQKITDLIKRRDNTPITLTE